MTTVARVTAEVGEWLDGRSVTLSPSLRHGCCGGHAELPVAQVGAPDDRERYRLEMVDGVEVFVDERLDALIDGSITVALDGWARWRRLVVLDGRHER